MGPKAQPPHTNSPQEDLDFASHQDNNLHPQVNAQTVKDVRQLLIVFRCINALCIWTFFQPDEYFQSLEPAWQMAFGPDSGAWITWARTPECLDYTPLTPIRSGGTSFAHRCIQLYLQPSTMSSISPWSSSSSSPSFGL